jgi:hypothetical protein
MEGSGAWDNSVPVAGGTGNSPPTSPPQGNPGGGITGAGGRSGGGGGGAGASGTEACGPSQQGTPGGVGFTKFNFRKCNILRRWWSRSNFCWTRSNITRYWRIRWRRTSSME